MTNPNPIPIDELVAMANGEQVIAPPPPALSLEQLADLSDDEIGSVHITAPATVLECYDFARGDHPDLYDVAPPAVVTLPPITEAPVATMPARSRFHVPMAAMVIALAVLILSWPTYTATETPFPKVPAIVVAPPVLAPVVAKAQPKPENYRPTLVSLTEAVRLNSNSADAHNRLAWFLATCPDPACRDGKQAFVHAKCAYVLSDGDPRYLSTLAAAYAECADWPSAVHWQERSLEQGGDQAVNRDRLAMYQAEKPYRDTSLVKESISQKPSTEVAKK